MTQTKAGLSLLAPKTLSTLIKTIESDLPGWWWSISQKARTLRISLGPSEYALLDVDRQMATIKEHEEFILDFVSSDDQVSDVPWNISTPLVDWLRANREVRIDTLRDELSAKKDKSFPSFVGTPRQQSRDDRHAFRKRYTQFLTELPVIEQAGVELREIYVGSCQLSVDVSLRGIGTDGKEFDISHDYQGNAILADSLDEAIKELKESISEKVA